MNAKKQTCLFNLEEWYGKRKVATIAWQKPYGLAKALKRMEELKDKPKGTYHKLV